MADNSELIKALLAGVKPPDNAMQPEGQNAMPPAPLGFANSLGSYLRSWGSASLAQQPPNWFGQNVLANPDLQSALTAASFVGPKMGKIRPEIVSRGNGMYDVSVGGKFAGTASVAGDGTKPFLSAVDIEKDFRRAGIAKELYNHVEKDLGRPIVPSPLGLTPEAMALWQKRLGSMRPEDRAALLAESRELGRGYGLKDADIDLRLKPLE